jgi:hypothetical protein
MVLFIYITKDGTTCGYPTEVSGSAKLRNVSIMWSKWMSYIEKCLRYIGRVDRLEDYQLS